MFVVPTDEDLERVGKVFGMKSESGKPSPGGLGDPRELPLVLEGPAPPAP